MCILRVQRDLGGRFERSEAGFRMGLVLHMRTFASSPPVAIREPSGWTWMEKMDSRLVSLALSDGGRISKDLWNRQSRSTSMHHPCWLCEPHHAACTLRSRTTSVDIETWVTCAVSCPASTLFS